MKKLLMFSLMIGLMITFAYAETKLEKIANNNVEFTETLILIDIYGVEFLQWGETDSYGQIRIDKELASAQQSFADAQALDVAKYKQKLIADAQKELDKILAIQAEMDKVVE